MEFAMKCNTGKLFRLCKANSERTLGMTQFNFISGLTSEQVRTAKRYKVNCAL